MAAVDGVTTVNAKSGVGTFGFDDGTQILTTYTYTYATGIVAGTALAADYEMPLSSYSKVTQMIDEWLRACDKSLGKPVFPAMPSYENEYSLDRSGDKCELKAKISGTTYAKVKWKPSTGMAGAVDIKARPAFTFDRSAFGVFIAIHRDFGDLCFRVADGQ